MRWVIRILRYRVAWVVAVVLALGAAAAIDRHVGLRAVNGEHPDVVAFADAPIESVLVSGDAVFAINRWGLFRATQSGRRWVPLRLPTVLPASGRLVRGSGDGRRLLYYVPAMEPGEFRYHPGLYASDDAGETWSRVSSRGDLVALHVPRGGDSFAVAAMRESPEGATHQLLRSRDGGRSWVTVFSPPGVGGSWSLRDDPRDPSLVVATRALGVSGRQYWGFRVERGGWSMLPHGDVEGRQPRGFSEYPDGGSIALYQQEEMTATLANYFGMDFGQRTHRHPERLSTGSRHYSFPINRAKAIDVTLSYDLPSGEMRIFDDPALTVAYGLVLQLPGGRVIEVQPGGKINDEKAEWMVSRDALKPQPSYASVRLSSTQPYRRKIILDNMATFRVTGEYRAQISLGSQGHVLLYSPVITVTVTEAVKN